jgi:hypothetical protein
MVKDFYCINLLILENKSRKDQIKTVILFMKKYHSQHRKRELKI